MNKKAFTLVEVMLVIAIISLMAAMLIPNYVQPRQASQTNACINNLRMIQAAKEQWAYENTNINLKAPTWEALNPYLLRNRTPICPSGGNYTIGPLDIDPTCSIRGHLIPGASMDATNLPEENTNALDLIISGLPYGKIAYLIPEKSHIDNAVEAELILSPKKTFQELEGAIMADQGSQSVLGTNKELNLKTASLKISPRMRATLESDSKEISISPETESVQGVSFKNDTVWTWHIVASKPGKYWMHIELSMLVDIDNHETYRTIESYKDNIIFEATVIQSTNFYLQEHWGMLTGAGSAFATIVGFCYRYREKLLYVWRKIKKKASFLKVT